LELLGTPNLELQHPSSSSKFGIFHKKNKNKMVGKLKPLDKTFLFEIFKMEMRINKKGKIQSKYYLIGK